MQFDQINIKITDEAINRLINHSYTNNIWFHVITLGIETLQNLNVFGPQLEQLKLSNVQIFGSGLEVLSTSCHQLRSLSLENTNCEGLDSFIKVNKNLRDVNIKNVTHVN